MNDNSTEEIQVNPEDYGIKRNSENMLCYLYTKEKKIVTYGSWGNTTYKINEDMSLTQIEHQNR